MYNAGTPVDSASNTSTSSPNFANSSDTYKMVALMVDKDTASDFLEADWGGKKRKKRKKQRTKKKQKRQAAQSSRYYSESKQYLLPYFLGAAHKENELLKTMIKLSLAASKGTLREDVLEVGCEVLDDGKG